MPIFPLELQIVIEDDDWHWYWNPISERSMRLDTCRSMRHRSIQCVPNRYSANGHTSLVEVQRAIMGHELRLWREYLKRKRRKDD